MCQNVSHPKLSKDKVRCSIWRIPSELKAMYGSASILKNSRVVFNISGNKFRLIADISYSFGTIFIVWFGTHAQYDQINAQEIDYAQN